MWWVMRMMDVVSTFLLYLTASDWWQAASSLVCSIVPWSASIWSLPIFVANLICTMISHNQHQQTSLVNWSTHHHHHCQALPEKTIRSSQYYSANWSLAWISDCEIFSDDISTLPQIFMIREKQSQSVVTTIIKIIGILFKHEKRLSSSTFNSVCFDGR